MNAFQIVESKFSFYFMEWKQSEKVLEIWKRQIVANFAKYILGSFKNISLLTSNIFPATTPVVPWDLKSYINTFQWILSSLRHIKDKYKISYFQGRLCFYQNMCWIFSCIFDAYVSIIAVVYPSDLRLVPFQNPCTLRI